MPRYFIQVAYKGTNYAGFQIQANANSVQAEVEKALNVFFKAGIPLTGSSRTDAGVHALVNYFHFDAEELPNAEKLIKSVYNLNAILPADIVVKSITPVNQQAHCRFDALYREYEYYIYQSKEPFSADRAYFYPYALDIEKLQQAAAILHQYIDFTTFSKRNSQVKTFNCTIQKSVWYKKDDYIIYNVQANRFLRGMVRGLVGTMLKVGIGKTTLEEFQAIIEAKNSSMADFSVPPQALFLKEVAYPDGIYTL
jgi:tRNA pseudouridine38-40 synthase